MTIRPCATADLDAMLAVINAAATAYAGVIPADRWHVPYMPPRSCAPRSPAACASSAGTTADGG